MSGPAEASPALLKIGLLASFRGWGTITARRPGLWCLEHVVLPGLRNGPGPEDDPVIERIAVVILWPDGLVETRTQ